MNTAVDTYAALFEKVSKSDQVTRTVKLAGFWSHPATAYSLGALGVGAGVPLAYALGQRAKKEEMDAERGRAFAAGMDAASAMPSMMSSPEQLGYLPEDVMPDENAMNYYGMAPGVDDMYGTDNPEFGSYE